VCVCVCVSHLRHDTPTLASVSVPVPQTANATAGVQVEHTEVKKHLQYTKRVLWSPRTHTVWRSVLCVWYCTTLAKNFTWRAWVWMSVFCVYSSYFLLASRCRWRSAPCFAGWALRCRVVRVQPTDWRTDRWHSCNAQPPFSLSINLKYFLKMKKTFTNYYNNYYCY